MPLSFANPEHLHHVLHLFKFFAAREDFTALVERAAHPFWLQLRRFVGQPILAAAGFQPALAGIEDSRMSERAA